MRSVDGMGMGLDMAMAIIRHKRQVARRLALTWRLQGSRNLFRLSLTTAAECG
jgi:hypothetical protein